MLAKLSCQKIKAEYGADWLETYPGLRCSTQAFCIVVVTSVAEKIPV